MLLTLAIRWIPPKMIRIVSTVSIPPMIRWSNPNAPSHAAQIVLLCTELKAKPNVIEINTAKNNRDIHLIAGQPWGYGSNAGIQELKDKLTGLEDLLEGQGARQEALLDEIERSIREATKAAQKSRFGLFK